MSAYSRNLTLFLQSLQKDCYSVDLIRLSDFRNPSGSGTKKGYEKARPKIFLIKHQRGLRQLNEALFRQILQQN